MAVLIFIIVLDALIVAMLMYWGLKHDAHTAIRSPESSKSVQVLSSQSAAAAEYLAGSQGSNQPEAGDKARLAAEASAAPSASPLGDEEERQRRREEALKRKAARRSPQSES